MRSWSVVGRLSSSLIDCRLRVAGDILACARTVCARPDCQILRRELPTSPLFQAGICHSHNLSTTRQLTSTNHDYDRYIAYSDSSSGSDTFSDLYRTTTSICASTLTIERLRHGSLRHSIYPPTNNHHHHRVEHPYDEQTRDNHFTDTIISIIKHQLCI